MDSTHRWMKLGSQVNALAAMDEPEIPLEVFEAINNDGVHPIKAWRTHRGMTISELSFKSNVSQEFISEIENGKKDGTVKSLRAIANVLGVDLDDWCEPPHKK